MGRKQVVDAWDDDWETLADKEPAQEVKKPGPAAPLTRAERLAKHEEANRKIWESAEKPEEEFHFLSANVNAPPPAVAPGFKPAMKLLSRKPAPQMVMKKDPLTGLQQLTLQDDEDEEGPKIQETPEQRRVRQQKELEEKQRKYEETRAKIFGETKSNPSSGRSTPGNVTPPQLQDGRQGGGRGRGRGGRGGQRGGGGGGSGHGRNDSVGKRQASQAATRELYDPNHSTKPGFSLQKRSDTGSPQPGRSLTPRAEDQIIRTPRGPDGSGRGFAQRGTKAG